MSGRSKLRSRILTCLAAVVLAAPGLVQAAATLRIVAQPGIYFDKEGNGLTRPEDVACDGKALVVVADTGTGRLLRYVIDGDRIEAQPEIALPQVSYTIRLAVTSAGEIYALDGKTRRVARVSATGEFAGWVAPTDDPATGPSIIRAIALDGADRPYLLDIANARVLVLGAGDRIERTIALPAGAHSFSDLAVRGDGAVLALETVERRLYVAKKDDTEFAPSGEPMKADLYFPTAMAFDAAGRLFIADEYGSGIAILGPDGTLRTRQSGMGWKEGRLRYPSGLCFSGSGLLFVADRENDRIAVFSVAE